MKITWAPRAKRRAEEYGEFIAQDNEEVAYAWLVGIFEEVGRLKDYPEQGAWFQRLGALMFGKFIIRATELFIKSDQEE